MPPTSTATTDSPSARATAHCASAQDSRAPSRPARLNRTLAPSAPAATPVRPASRSAAATSAAARGVNPFAAGVCAVTVVAASTQFNDSGE